MRTKTLLICVREKEYAERLAEYIAGRQEYALSVHYCERLEMTQRIATEMKVDYLLMDSDFSGEERRSVPAARRFLLTEHPEEKGEGDEIPIFRYRAAREILNQIMQACVDDPQISRGLMHRKELKIIGFYSPVGRLGQTGLALELAEELAKKDQVLYLNLCPHETKERFSQGEGSASLEDIIYFLRQGAPNLTMRLKALAGQMSGFDFLAPFRTSTDLEEVEAGEWKKLLDDLEEDASYGYLILDLRDGIRGLRGILKSCAAVFMPVLSDEFSVRKAEAFSAELGIQKERELMSRIRKIPMEKEKSRLVASCMKTLKVS